MAPEVYDNVLRLNTPSNGFVMNLDLRIICGSSRCHSMFIIKLWIIPFLLISSLNLVAVCKISFMPMQFYHNSANTHGFTLL